MHERKHARILLRVCTDKFYHSLLKLEVTGTCEHTEQFQGLITNYFSDTVTSVVNRELKEISIKLLCYPMQIWLEIRPTAWPVLPENTWNWYLCRIIFEYWIKFSLIVISHLQTQWQMHQNFWLEER